MFITEGKLISSGCENNMAAGNQKECTGNTDVKKEGWGLPQKE